MAAVVSRPVTGRWPLLATLVIAAAAALAFWIVAAMPPFRSSCSSRVCNGAN